MENETDNPTESQAEENEAVDDVAAEEPAQPADEPRQPGSDEFPSEENPKPPTAETKPSSDEKKEQAGPTEKKRPEPGKINDEETTEQARQNETVSNEYIRQVTQTVVARLLAEPTFPDVSYDDAAKISGEVGQLLLTRDPKSQKSLLASLQGVTLEVTGRELVAYFSSDEGRVVWEELQSFPGAAKALIVEETFTLMLKGHTGADALRTIVNHLTAEEFTKPANAPQDLETFGVAIHDAAGFSIKIDPNFASKIRGPEDTSPEAQENRELFRYLLRHEVSHGMIAKLKSNFYANVEFKALVDSPNTDVNGLGNHEQTVFRRAISDDPQDRARAGRFESFATAQHIQQLQQSNTRETKLYLLEEMLTERLNLFLESDGTPADFILKRLEHSEMFRRMKETRAPGTVDGSTPEAQHFQKLETILRQGKRERWPNEKLVPELQAWSQSLSSEMESNPQAKEFFEDFDLFLLESAALHGRFSRTLRGPDGKPFILQSKEEGYRKNLVEQLKTSPGPESSSRVIVWDQIDDPLRKGVKTTETPGFWEWLAETWKEGLSLFKF